MKKTESVVAAASVPKPMTRNDVTELVVEARLKKSLSWSKIAKTVGQSKEWTTAALLGQMKMTKPQPEQFSGGFGLRLGHFHLAQQRSRCPFLALTDCLGNFAPTQTLFEPRFDHQLGNIVAGHGFVCRH